MRRARWLYLSRNNPRHQAGFQRARRIDGRTEKQHLGSALIPDQPRQQQRAPGLRHESETHEWHRQTRVARCDDQVAVKQERHADPDRCAVHGATVGIGVTLLLHCDLVVAARNTRLSVPFVRLGLVPEAGSSLLLPRLIGYQRAAEMLLLGAPIDSARALEAGLVTRVVEDDALMNEARALALSVAQQPAGALLATRRLLHSRSSDVRERIEEELSAFQERLGAAEFRAAAQDFFNKKR